MIKFEKKKEPSKPKTDEKAKPAKTEKTSQPDSSKPTADSKK